MATATTNLPPGPREPVALQTTRWVQRPIPFMEQCRRKYGKRFTIRLAGVPPFVHLCDPDDIKALFTAPPDVIHPGEGAATALEPVVGKN